MESYENGLLRKEETGGLEITWGNGEIILELIRQIANRQGLGALLAEGVRYAANKIGGLAKEYAVETKGLEVVVGGRNTKERKIGPTGLSRYSLKALWGE